MSVKMHGLLILLAAIIAGCRGSEPFDYAKVTGKVTYEDGSLIPAGRIVLMFLSQEDKGKGPAVKPRPGIAEVDVKTGTFDCVTSHNYGDGIVPGKHRIVFQYADGFVPVEYTSPDKSPLVVDARDAPFHFKIPKQKK